MLFVSCPITTIYFLATPEANLSAGMQFLNSSYTSYFNRRHRRSGREAAGLWSDAVYELLIGSDAFVAKMRMQLSSRDDDPDLPQLRAMRARPSLETIADRSADVFGVDPDTWRPGRRVDNASRAVVAYLARREYGFPAVDIARYLGYSRSSSVTQAVARVTNRLGHLQRKINRIKRYLSND